MKMHRRIMMVLLALVLCMSLALPVCAADPEMSDYGFIAIFNEDYTDSTDYMAVAVKENGEYYVYTGVNLSGKQNYVYVSMTDGGSYKNAYEIIEDRGYEGGQGIYRFKIGDELESGEPKSFPKVAGVSKNDTVYFVNYVHSEESFYTEETVVTSVKKGIIKTEDCLEDTYAASDFVVIFDDNTNVVGFCKGGTAYTVDQSKDGSGFSMGLLVTLISIAIGVVVVLLLKKKKNTETGPVPPPPPGTGDDDTVVYDPIPEDVDPEPIAGSLKLRCHGGYQNGRAYDIPADGLSIGRELSNNICYPPQTPGISRQHAKLFWQDGQLMLLDLDSSNGTYLNQSGRIPPMRPVPLQPGDCFYLGENKNCFEVSAR